MESKKKSDVLSELTQIILDLRKTDKEMGIVETETTKICTDIFSLVSEIDSLD